MNEWYVVKRGKWTLLVLPCSCFRERLFEYLTREAHFDMQFGDSWTTYLINKGLTLRGLHVSGIMHVETFNHSAIKPFCSKRLPKSSSNGESSVWFIQWFKEFQWTQQFRIPFNSFTVSTQSMISVRSFVIKLYSSYNRVPPHIGSHFILGNDSSSVSHSGLIDSAVINLVIVSQSAAGINQIPAHLQRIMEIIKRSPFSFSLSWCNFLFLASVKE